MKVGMILDAPFPPDLRVEKEALTLVSQGHEVILFCLSFCAMAQTSTIVIKNVAVINVANGKISKGQTVIIKGNKITSIDILDSTDELFASQKAQLDKWNAVLGK